MAWHRPTQSCFDLRVSKSHTTNQQTWYAHAHSIKARFCNHGFGVDSLHTIFYTLVIKYSSSHFAPRASLGYGLRAMECDSAERFYTPRIPTFSPQNSMRNYVSSFKRQTQPILGLSDLHRLGSFHMIAQVHMVQATFSHTSHLW